MNESTVQEHLNQALTHLREAMRLSVQIVAADGGRKNRVGQLWEQFLGQFFDAIRNKSRESKINLMSWISFSKVWRG